MNTNWRAFDNGTSINKKGSENGNIVYDIEHLSGARITLEEKADIAPFAITLGVYGLMFHTCYKGVKADADAFVQDAADKIEQLFKLLDISEEKRNDAWNEAFNALLDKLAE